MITFETAINVAQQIFQRWSDYNKLSEVTIIRDIYGRLAFLISGQDGLDKNSLTTALQTSLGHYDAQHLLWEGSEQNELARQMTVEIKRLRQVLVSDPNCTWYLMERTIAKKAWIDYSGQVDPIWTYDEAKDGKRPKVVTFYSFKGGMGRTTALAAVAILLAQHGRHVLAIDTDIEGPGLATLFFGEDQIERGTVDFYLESCTNNGNSIDMSAYMMQVSDTKLTEGMTGNIYLIPAGNVDEHYVRKLGRIDYQDAIPSSMRNHLSRLIINAVDFIQDNGHQLDYILLDARAGFHDMGGVVTAQLPHGVVLFGRNTPQSWNGLKQVVQTLANTQQEKLPIAIVDSMSDSSEQHRQTFKTQSFTLCCDNYYSADDTVPGIDAESEAHTPIYVSYISRLNEEIQLYSDGSEMQEKAVEETKNVLCSEEYRLIEARIRQWFGDDAQSEVSGNDAG